jgi:hypothetical protein
MKTRLRASRLAMVMILLAGIAAAYMPTPRSAASAGPSVFGFNYWPPSDNCTILTDAKWNSYGRPQVAADLDHMASLGAGVIRLMFWPEFCGFAPPATGNATMTGDYQQEVSNLLELLDKAAARNMKVIIAFGNDWFYHKCDSACGPYQNEPGGKQNWQYYYKDRPDDGSRFATFLGDSVTWINTLVDKVHYSGRDGAVLYYDYQAEYTKTQPNNGGVPNAGWYMTFMYQYSHIPPGKRGVSPFKVAQPGDPNPDLDDVADLRYQFNSVFGSSWHLDFVAWDSYFDNGPNVINTNIQGSYDRVKGIFPDSTVLLSEFGSNSNYPSSGCCEQGQQQTVYNVVNAVRDRGIPYYLNWWLWDGAFDPNNPFGQAWGGSYRDQPKDILGGFSQNVQRLIQNGDMEQASGAPLHWSASGTVPVSLVDMGPYQPDAATNNWYARLQASGQSSDSAWLVSEGVSVRGGDTVYLNGFIRSNMANITMNVIEYDSSYNWLRTSGGPGFTPSGWSWNNYLSHTAAQYGWSDGWHVSLRSDTRIVIIMIHADVRSSPAYLDVDTVSAWESVP